MARKIWKRTSNALVNFVRKPWGVSILILCATTIYGLFVTRHAWHGLPGGGDVSGHLARTQFAIHHLFAHFRIDGWFPLYGNGMRIFQVYGPGYALTVGLLRLLTFNQLSIAGTATLLGVLSYIAVPWSVAWFSSRLRFTPLACALAGVLSLCIESNFGGGLRGLYEIGLLPNALAVPLFFAVLGCIIWLWESPSRKSMLTTVFFTVWLVLTHPITVVVLALCLPLIARFAIARDKVTLRRFDHALAAFVAILAVTAFWLLPFAASGPEHGVIVTIARPSFSQFWHQVWIGHSMASIVIVRLSMLSWLICAWFVYKRKFPFAAILPALLSCWIVFMSYLIASFGRHSELALELPNRAFVFIGIMGVIPLAFVLERIIMRAFAAEIGVRFIRVDIALISFVAILALVCSSTAAQRNIRQTAATPTDDFRQLAKKLNKVVPANGRILLTVTPIGDQIDGTGMYLAPRWLAWKTGHLTSHIYPWEGTPADGAGAIADSFAQNETVDDDAPLLRSYGISYVIAYTPEFIDPLKDDKTDYQHVADVGGFKIFKVLPTAKQPSPSDLLQAVPEYVDSAPTPLTANLRQRTDDSYKIDFNASKSTIATLAVAWSRGWHATIDGKHIDLSQYTDTFEGNISRDKLLAVSLPTGKHTLELHYELGFLTKLGIFITLIALILLMIPPRYFKKLARAQDKGANVT
jgi:hypothetical protein